MESPLVVKMFGGFSISYQSRVIDTRSNRSSKLWTLLEYLFAFRGKSVSQDDLIDILWPDGAEVENPSNTLKTVLYRVRTLLNELDYMDSKQIITYSRGAYAINPTIPLEVDVDVFEQRCKAAGEPGIPAEDKISLLKSAIALYLGDFLPNSSHEAWSIPIQAYYRTMYTNAVLDATALLSEQGRWDEVLTMSEQATAIDRYVEPFHQALITALVMTDQMQSAASHYHYVTNMLYTELGVSPSEELSELYTLVRRENNKAELDLNIIKNSLIEQTRTNGAFRCEYAFFKELFQLESRTLARNGQSVFISLLSLTGADGERPTNKVMNNAMSMLSDVISSTLRRGDIYTRYSVSQFLLMISTVSLETGTDVMERLIKKFKTMHPKASVKVDYKLQPLDPVNY